MSLSGVTAALAGAAAASRGASSSLPGVIAALAGAGVPAAASRGAFSSLPGVTALAGFGADWGEARPSMTSGIATSAPAMPLIAVSALAGSGDDWGEEEPSPPLAPWLSTMPPCASLPSQLSSGTIRGCSCSCVRAAA